jgi:hypothetical protein
MKYLVYTPFRCGSSYLTRFIEKNTNTTAKFFDNYKDFKDGKNLILKCHSEIIDDDVEFDYIFTCIRKPTDIFASSFIKDINTDKDRYPYHYTKEVIFENMNDIINHFQKFDWDAYEWLSYDYNFIQLRKFTGINIWNEGFDKNKGYAIFDTNPKLIIITHDIMFNRFDLFQELCRDELKFSNLNKGVFSFRNSDNYGDFYKTFLDNIPENFYKKYKYLDDRIVDKFL